MLTKFDLDCIYWDVDPPASEAFERLARDHGRRFAEGVREQMLAQKLIDFNLEAMRAGLPRMGKH